jgi:hypothetical protein
LQQHYLQVGVLIDGGANGNLSNSDVRVIENSNCRANVTFIGDQKIHGLPIALVAASIQTKLGFIIGMLYQYVQIGKGRPIHSTSQMRKWGVIVNVNP